MGLSKNKSKIVHIKFGVPFFDVFDSRFNDFSVPIAVRGEIVFFVKNYKKFLKKNGFDGMNWNEFQNLLRSAVIRYVKDFITNVPSKYDIPVVHLEKKIDKLSTIVKGDLASRIKKEFKIQVSNVDITMIEVDKTSSGYQYLQSVTKDIEGGKIYARTELELSEMHERSKIDMEDYKERLDIKREMKRRLQKLLIPALFVVGALIVILLIVLILKT